MREFLHYIRELLREAVATAIFVLGLFSTTLTFLPGLGFSPPRPALLRITGVGAMIAAFLFASYRVYARQGRLIEQLTSDLQALRLDADRPAPVDIERDVDALRRFLLQYYRNNPSPLAVPVVAARIAQELGWQQERLDAAALRATGNFGALEIRFDGAHFWLERIPV
jgi:hypothetical protein